MPSIAALALNRRWKPAHSQSTTHGSPDARKLAEAETVGIPDGNLFVTQGKKSMKPPPFRASLSALAIMLAVGSLASVSAAGQDPVTSRGAKPTAVTNSWTPARTPDGQPDLQGVWLNNSATPFERPKSLEGRQFLTDDE